MKRNIFIADLVLIFLVSILPVSVKAQIISTIAGCGIGDDSLATKAELFAPNYVAADTSGNIYIVDQGNNRIRKVGISGIMTTVAGTGIGGYSGDGGQATAAELYYPSGITTDMAGNIYVSDGGNNCIRKITAAGIISTFAGNSTAGYGGDGGPATSAELNGPQGIAIDTSGNLYIADISNERVRKVDTAGIITTVAGNGIPGYTGDGIPATSAEMDFPWDVATDRKGNFYISDYNNSRVRKVDTAGMITTIAGNGIHGYSGDGGPATAAEIKTQSGLFADTSGNVYFSDGFNFRVRKIDTGGVITTVAGDGNPGFSGNGGPADSARFCKAAGLTMDRLGNIFVADNYNNQVRKISITDTITTFAGQNGFFCDGVAAAHTEISVPENIVVDTSGNVLVADYYNNRIRLIDASGTISTVAGNGVSGIRASFSGDGGNADSAQIFYPTAVAVDHNGNIYIADTYNFRIRKVNATDGVITTIAGNGSGVFSGDGGPATAAELGYPSGVAVDTAGNVYIADGGNARIRKINTSGIITTIAGNGTAGYGGDGGPANHAQIIPADVAVDQSGNVYIADGTNNRIRKVDSSGIITTIAGTGTAGFSGDGSMATLAEINYSSGIKVDGTGNVYFSDNGNNRIRMIDTSGIITTIAGNGTGGFSGDGGIATLAEINGPSGVAVDKTGNVYIADYHNYRIRKVSSTLSAATISKEAWNVTVYPNPTNGHVIIETPPDMTQGGRIIVYDIVGKEMERSAITKSKQVLNMENFADGVYIVQVINATGEKKNVKVIKE